MNCYKHIYIIKNETLINIITTMTIHCQSINNNMIIEILSIHQEITFLLFD